MKGVALKVGGEMSGVVQSVKRRTPDFGSCHDFRAVEWSSVPWWV